MGDQPPVVPDSLDSQIESYKAPQPNEISPNEFVQRSRSYVAVPRMDERIYEITESELGRLEQSIKDISPERKLPQYLWPISAGAFIGGLFTLITLFTVHNVSPYIWSGTIFLLILTFVFGVAFFIEDVRVQRRLRDDVDKALNEVNTVKQYFSKPQDYD